MRYTVIEYADSPEKLEMVCFVRPDCSDFYERPHRGNRMSETTVETGIPVLFDSLPILVEDFDFPTYLGDPAPSPSLTSSLVRELLQTAPRKVWENCARLNPDYKEKKKDIFDLGSAAHALFIGEGSEIVVVNEDDWRTKARQGSERRPPTKLVRRRSRSPTCIASRPWRKPRKSNSASIEGFETFK